MTPPTTADAPRTTDHDDVTADLSRLFQPSTVAVVGASDREGRPNTGIWRQVARWARQRGATALPVNPRRASVDGVDCAASLADIDVDVDVVVVVVDAVEEVVRQAAEINAAFCIIFSAGFAEQGDEGRRAQDRLVELAGTMRLVGPNTNLNLFESFRTDLVGPSIAMITQSGHQGRPIFQTQDLGVRISHWAPVGNEADLEFADFARWFAAQPEVGAIAAYVEGFKDGPRLLRALDHCALAGVPITLVKVGRTPVGSSMAASHTGKLTGSEDVVEAALRQFGVTRVDGLDEVADTAQLLARSPHGPAGARDEGAVVYSISGGTGAHMADMCAAAGIPIARLSSETQQVLHQWIPDYLHVANPVDNGGHPVGDERGRLILDAIVADPATAVLIAPITGAFPPMSDRLAQDLVDVAETTDIPVCVVWGSPVGTESAYRDILLGSSRISVFRTFGNCVTAVKAWWNWHAFRESYISPFSDVPEPTPRHTPPSDSMASDDHVLSEHEAKKLLGAYGISTTREAVVASVDAAVEQAEALGWPVVAKAGAAIAHKSDLGLVQLGLRTPDDVRAAYNAIGDHSNGLVLIAEAIETTGAVECLVGMSTDPLFGPVVTVGFGGVLAEVLQDTAVLIPPFTRQHVHRMVAGLRGAALLDGTRGRGPVDVDALVDVVMQMQELATDVAHELGEVEINPLLVMNHGAIALDALAVRRS